MHLLRSRGDIQADGAVHAVRVPFDDVTGDVARSHEAVVIASMAIVLAPAEAGDVAQNLRMLRGERVRGPNDLRRPGRCVRGKLERRQLLLPVRSKFGHGGRVGGNLVGRGRRCGGVRHLGSIPAKVRERTDRADDGHKCDGERPRGRTPGTGR